MRSEVVRHHLHQHGREGVGLIGDSTAIHAGHQRHVRTTVGAMFELIQHRNHTFTASAGQGVKGDVALFHGMSEAMILEHAALTDTDFLIYTGDFCGYCRALKNLLEGHELSYVEYNFDHHDGFRKAVVQATGHRTVPVVFDLRGEQPLFIGGFDETNRYLKKKS